MAKRSESSGKSKSPRLHTEPHRGGVFLNFDGSLIKVESEDGRHQTEAFAKLERAGINSAQLARLVLLPDAIQKGMRAVAREKVAVEKQSIWKRIAPVQRLLKRALNFSKDIDAIPVEWDYSLLTLCLRLNRFSPHPVYHDVHWAKTERGKTKVDVTARAGTPRAKQTSRFAGELMRRVYALIHRFLVKRTGNNLNLSEPSRTQAADLTATFLRATCPTWFADLTTGQVRRRVARKLTPGD